MKDKTKNILSELESGYDLIAGKFSSTRAFMWRDLGFIKNMVKPDDRILDFGCGNGRLAGFLGGNFSEYMGVDISQKLIDFAKQRYSSEKTEFIKISANAKRSDRATKKECGRTSFALPFKDESFDIVFSIAVFHHFPSKAYTQKVAKELHRILKSGGRVVITVWNLWQKQYLKYQKKSKKEWIDAEIPFKSGNKVFQRYHHPFKSGELEKFFREAGFKTLEKKEGWNLVYIGSKPVVDK
ncbi:MAG: methyltransferase domain-containing protein [Candidatus Moranbacteria bacterium]|nr:methyltransferase domain-containing protein [Candidatus Moranbacteria bacterium]